MDDECRFTEGEPFGCITHDCLDSAALCTHAAAALRAKAGAFERINADLGGSLRAAMTELGELRTRVRELEGQLADVRQENRVLGERIREGSLDVTEADRRLDSLLEEVAQMEGTMVSVETAKILTSRLSRAEQAVGRLQAAAAVLRTNGAAMADTIRRLAALADLAALSPQEPPPSAMKETP